LGHDDAADAGAPRQQNAAMVALALLLRWRRYGRGCSIVRLIVLFESATLGAALLLIRHFFIVAD
jgi:hypothetical protein